MAMDLRTSTTRLGWMLCLFLVAAIGGEISVHATEFAAVAGHSAAIKSLGRIVYLPRVSLQNDHNSERLIFDPDVLKDIAKTSEEAYHSVNFKWFDSSDKFKASIALNMGVKGSAKGLSMSVNGEFERVTGSETNVTVAELHAERRHSSTYIPKDQLKDLEVSEDFWDDFASLPDIVEKAEEESAWSPFSDFMSKWGSHIVYKAYTGAVYQRWSSAKSDLGYSEDQLKVKACVEAEGLKPVGAALEVCAGYSRSERQDSQKLSTFDSKRVKGGSAGMRSKLATGLATPELLEKFLNEEAEIDEQPVRYEYISVWDFIRGGSTDVGNNRRALTLQAYYEGWKATGCPLVTTRGQVNDIAQGMMAEVDPSTLDYTGYYLCARRCLGCHHYSADCHFTGTWKGGCCSLYGPSAISVDSDDRAYISTNEDKGWCAYSNGCRDRGGLEWGCFCLDENAESGCDYTHPLQQPPQPRLKYKIIWNQHQIPINEENPEIASVVDAQEP